MMEDEKNVFLMQEFCEDTYEREEMQKWICEKGINVVYDIIQDMFYKED